MRRPYDALPALYAALLSHFSFLILIFILLLAFAVRVHLLGAQSFWNDEGSSYIQATRTLTDIAYHAGRDIHPPGYYWLLAGWRLLVGETEFALRAFSTFVSLLTVAVTYALGRRLFGTVAGVAAALFIALNSFSIYYAQEARMYALLALWAGLSLWALVNMVGSGGRLRRQGAKDAKSVREGRLDGSPLQRFLASFASWRFILPLALINAAGLYTQYAYVYVMLAQGILIVLCTLHSVLKTRPSSLVTRYVPLLRFTAANLLALLLFLPWLPTALQQITTWPSTGQPTPIAEAFGTILAWLVYGITGQNTSLAVPWLLLLFGLIIVRRGRAGDSWALLVPVTLVVVSIGVFLAQELFRPNNLKFLLPAQIGAALWMGRGVWVLWEGLTATKLSRDLTPVPSPRAVRGARRHQEEVVRGEVNWRPTLTRLAGLVAAFAVLVTLWQGLQPLYHDPAYQRADYRAMARLAEAELQAGDVIVLNGPNQAEVFGYYYRGDAQVIGLPAGLGGDDEQTRVAMLDLVEAAGGNNEGMYGQVMTLFWGDRERDPNQIVEGTLDFYGFSVGDVWYGDVRLAHYIMSTSSPSPMVDGEVYAELDGERMSVTASYTNEGQPGAPLLVSLTWLNLTEQPIEQRYKVFVQLLNSDGVLVTQHDSEPQGGSAPTNSWQLGVGITDRHALIVPPDTPPGTYTLIAGMYDSALPYARLTVDGGGDHVVIGTVTIR
ncbi:MAG: glycosyltransferase family 39 protein [Chloroflexota bacterium]|nr:glycosyltransferase family 39 protein [Chloroflexota bacterium]